jgi:two-component system phosphate regulon sensor histidine kinase PhoR
MKLSTVGDSLDQGIVTVNSHGVVKYANREAQQILGPASDLVGSQFAATAEYRLVHLVDTTRQSGSGQALDLVEIGGRSVRAHSVLMKSGDVAVLMTDETRLNHLETVRRDFVANVSHELRTPVTAISLIVETLNNGALEDPQAAKEFVRRIGLEVSNLGQMVEELLALSKMESDTSRVLNLEPVSMTSIVDALSRLKPLLDAHQQELVVDVPDGIADIQGDSRLVEQLFRNLVHNASKYSPDGTTITLSARNSNDGHVVVKVIDEGVGIAPEDQPRIFERFWKADRSRQSDGQGNGLGLAIVRHAVEAHGGTISVKSRPQHGATFIVSLPSSMRESDGADSSKVRP